MLAAIDDRRLNVESAGALRAFVNQSIALGVAVVADVDRDCRQAEFNRCIQAVVALADPRADTRIYSDEDRLIDTVDRNVALELIPLFADAVAVLAALLAALPREVGDQGRRDGAFVRSRDMRSVANAPLERPGLEPHRVLNRRLGVERA